MYPEKVDTFSSVGIQASDSPHTFNTGYICNVHGCIHCFIIYSHVHVHATSHEVFVLMCV